MPPSTRSPTTNNNKTTPSPLTLAYGPATYNSVTRGLTHRHKLHEATLASHHFHLGQYAACASLCNTILAAEGPAEAIQARAHMFLAREGVGSADAEVRARHAEQAVMLWGCVVERRGLSRFPVAKAKEGLEEARVLVQVARGNGSWDVGVEEEGGVEG